MGWAGKCLSGDKLLDLIVEKSIERHCSASFALLNFFSITCKFIK